MSRQLPLALLALLALCSLAQVNSFEQSKKIRVQKPDTQFWLQESSCGLRSTTKKVSMRVTGRQEASKSGSCACAHASAAVACSSQSSCVGWPNPAQATSQAICAPILSSFCPPQAQDDSEQVSCRVHVVNNTASPDDNMLGHVRSSLKVLAAADIMDVSVILQVQHPDMAALQVSQDGVQVKFESLLTAFGLRLECDRGFWLPCARKHCRLSALGFDAMH